MITEAFFSNIKKKKHNSTSHKWKMSIILGKKQICVSVANNDSHCKSPPTYMDCILYCDSRTFKQQNQISKHYESSSGVVCILLPSFIAIWLAILEKSCSRPKCWTDNWMDRQADELFDIMMLYHCLHWEFHVSHQN